MIAQTVHQKLEKIRKPRVHIQYEIETENGIVQKELPFVVGVLGDFSGDGEETKNIREKKFVQIDNDNFDQIMTRIQPRLHFQVENCLSPTTPHLNVDLKFHKMDDFLPDQLVQQIPELNRLFQIRNHLRDLLTKADRSEQLESILENILQDPLALEKLSQELETP